MTGEIEKRLEAMGVTLPSPAAPAANYVPYTLVGGFLYVSGQVPVGPSGFEFEGKCGAEYGVEDGQKAARLCAINVLAQAKAALSDLDRIERLAKIVGFVASTPDFHQQPLVINGASDFLVEALGDKGKHARSAVGVAVLPFNLAVEVEAIFHVS